MEPSDFVRETNSEDEHDADDAEFFVLRKRLRIQDISADYLVFDWHHNKSQWSTDTSLLLWKAESSDCTFLVGSGRDERKQVVKCHRMVLSYASTVFVSMLYGPLAPNEEVIEIPDIEPEVFKLMCSYFYSGKLEPTSMDAGLALVYAAQKYMLATLMQECYLFLMVNLRPDNVLKCFEFADEIGYVLLRDTCFKVICDSCETILCHPSFEEVKFATLAAICNEDTLNLDSEANLIAAAFRWAEKEASRKLQEIAPLHLRNILGPIVPNFRFLTMSPEDFTERFIHVDYFTLEEKNALLVNIISRDKLPMPRGFSETHRERKAAFLKRPQFCFSDSLTNASRGEHLIMSTEHNRLECVLKFSCDRDVRLIGLSLPERVSGEDKVLFDWENDDEFYIEEIDVAVHGEDHQLIHNEVFKEKIKRSGIVRCNMSEPLMISSGKTYKISVTFNECGCYSSNEQMSEVYQGHDISLRNTATSKKLKLVKALHYSLF